MGFRYGFLVTVVFCLYVSSSTVAGSEDACFEKLSMETKQNLMAMMETCKKKVGLEEMPKPEELEKNGFDDKVGFPIFWK